MSMKISIGEVLSKAWKIIWKFKVLWIFGILAGCGASNGSRFNFNNNSAGNWNNSSGQVPDFFRQFQNLHPEQMARELIGQYSALIALVILLMCVLWLACFALGVMGKTGLIKGAGKADSGAVSLGFGELWTESSPFFWRMVGLSLLVGLPFFILTIVLLAVLGFAGYAGFHNTSGGGLVAMLAGMAGVFFGAICVISILSFIIGMIVEQAQNAIVLEDLGVLESLGRGWKVFKSAALTIVVVAIILGVLGWIVSLVAALPIIAIAIPAALGLAATQARNFMIPLVIAGSCFVLYLPVLLIVNGILQSYIQSVWTLLFRRLTAQPVPEPAAEIVSQVP